MTLRSTFAPARKAEALTLAGEAEAALVDAADRVLHALRVNVARDVLVDLHVERAARVIAANVVAHHVVRVKEVVLLALKVAADIVVAVVLTAPDAVAPADEEVEVVSRAVVAFRRPPSLTT